MESTYAEESERCQTPRCHRTAVRPLTRHLTSPTFPCESGQIALTSETPLNITTECLELVHLTHQCLTLSVIRATCIRPLAPNTAANKSESLSRTHRGKAGHTSFPLSLPSSRHPMNLYLLWRVRPSEPTGTEQPRRESGAHISTTAWHWSRS